MKKQLILLATSKKYGRYCVAGADVQSGALIRLITSNSDAHYAIEPAQMTYADRTLAKKLDLVEVECTDRSISYYQSENYVLKQNAVWKKLRESSIEEVLQVHPANQSAWVFYDRERKLHQSKFMDFTPREIKSLLFIQPESCALLIQQSWERRQAMLAFVYKGVEYEPFPITDFEYLAAVESVAEGTHKLPKSPHLLVSVGECFEQDKCHYKIAAGVFP
ncbi:MAG: hypothetical protein Q8M98_11190 [Candidatus Cloacimonadaceae bacterium]|nr:hypothetical protein [Candidatus Cloacimonadaceae bacterium]MDP3115317.1 hypothetical protein [Candidatus Cloacimonadaceae bacterium]